MRCKACDKLLNEFEIKKVDPTTGDYLDLCGNCHKESNAAISEWGSDVDLYYESEEFIPFDENIG